MLKSFLKNYWKNIKHVFTCLGVFFLFLCGAISVLFRGLYKVIIYVVEGITDLVGTLMENVGEYISSIFEKFVSDLANDTIFFSSNYTKELFSDTASKTFGKTIEQAQELVHMAMMQATIYFVFFFIILIIGIVVSFLLTRHYVRGSMIKGKFFKRILVSLLYLLVLIGFTVLAGVVGGPVGVILGIFALIIVMFGSLVEAYFIHKNPVLKFKEVVSFKNSLMLFISEALCLVFIILFTLVFYLIQPILGFVIVIPVVIVSITVTGANAESYVISLIAKKNLDVKEVSSEEFNS